MFFSSPFLYSMYAIMAGSTIMTLFSPNWMTAWVMLEINMLSFLPVICMSKSNQETEAATKYFLVQAFGSLMLLTGSVMLYQPKMSIFMSITLMLALLLKLGAFPCHFWYPSMMSSISWSNCLILSTWQKIAPLSLLSAATSSPSSSKVLLILAAMNALTGGILGMNQTHLRPLLAYSSIGHLGWMLSMQALGMTKAWIFYFIMYCITVTPVFLTFMMTNSKTIFDLFNINKVHFLMPAILMLLMLSLAGVPPLTGFMPKLMVMMTMVESNFFILLVLLAGSYMNLYYYLMIAMASIMCSNNNLKWTSPYLKILPLSIIIASSLIGMIMIF